MKQGPKICQYRNDMDYCLWYKRESYNDQETSIAWYKNLWHTRKCNIIGEKYYALSSVIWLFIHSFWLKFKSLSRHLTVEISNVAEHFNKYTGSQLFMSTIEIWHFLRDMDTQKWKNGLNYTITEHEIVSIVMVGCYSTDKVLENVVKHVFNEMLGVQLNTVL